MPLMISISSVLPLILLIRLDIRPQLQGPGMIEVRSLVLYRSIGVAVLISMESTSSPVSPSGTPFRVFSSTISI